MSFVSVGALLFVLAGVTVLGGQVHAYTTKIAAQLYAPEPYISTVLETPGKLSDGTKEEDH